MGVSVGVARTLYKRNSGEAEFVVLDCVLYLLESWLKNIPVALICVHAKS